MVATTIFSKLKTTLQRWFFLDLFKGLQVTGKHFFRRKNTVHYPDESVPKAANYRGLLALRRYPSGEDRCIACKLCEAACPAMAITIESEQRATDNARKASRFDIDLSKCMFCGLCEEACPVDAIVATSESNYHFTDLESHVVNKQQLLAIGDQYEHSIIKVKTIS